MKDLPTPLVTISLQEYEYLKDFMNGVKASLKEPEYARLDTKTGTVYILSSIEAEITIKDRIIEIENQNKALERELMAARSEYAEKIRDNIDLLNQKSSLEFKLAALEIGNILEDRKWWQFWK